VTVIGFQICRYVRFTLLYFTSCHQNWFALSASRSRPTAAICSMHSC